MNNFKMKLIITHFIVFITSLDAITDPKEGPPPIRTTEVTITSREELCVSQLDTIKYSRDKTFLDHYLKIFNGFNEEDNFSDYDSQIESIVTKCLVDPSTVLDWQPLFDLGTQLVSTVSRLFCNVANKLASSAIRMLCSFDGQSGFQNANQDAGEDIETSDEAINRRGLIYFCDILTIIYSMYDIKNAYKYCDNPKNDDQAPEEKDVIICQEALQDAGFIFVHGLDNYAYHLKMKSEETEIAVEGEDKGDDSSANKKYKDDYIQYFTTEITKRGAKNQGNTKVWCQIQECESELNSGGFTSKMSGQENHKAIEIMHGGTCNAIQSDLTKEYCNYLYTNSAIKSIVLHGSFHWCMYKIEKKAVKTIHIQ